MDPLVYVGVGAGGVLLCLAAGLLIGYGLWGRRIARLETERDAALARAEATTVAASARSTGAAADLARAVDSALAGDDFDSVLHASFGGADPAASEHGGTADSGDAPSDPA